MSEIKNKSMYFMSENQRFMCFFQCRLRQPTDKNDTAKYILTKNYKAKAIR